MFLFLFVSNWIFTNCHSRSNIDCKSHHNKPPASGTNRNTAPTASVPSSNGSVPTTKWPRPDSTDHCTITKRCYCTGSDSHSTGSSRSRPTTGMSTDNRTANVERSIHSFFGGMNQIRELILWSTHGLNRSVIYSRTLISHPPSPPPRDFSHPRSLEQNLSIYKSNLNLSSLFQSNTYFVPLLNPVFLISRKFGPISFFLWGSKWTGFHEIWNFQTQNIRYQGCAFPQGFVKIRLNYTKRDKFTDVNSFFRHSYRFKANP